MSDTIEIKPWKADEEGPLVGVTEAAEMLGVERTRIARWRRTGLFPEAFGHTKATRLWLRTDVEEFKRQREGEGLRALRRELDEEAEEAA